MTENNKEMELIIQLKKAGDNVLADKNTFEYREVENTESSPYGYLQNRPVMDIETDNLTCIRLTPISAFKGLNTSYLPFIHTTSIGGCLRPMQLRLEGKKPLSQSHFVTARGSIVHEIADRMQTQMMKSGYLIHDPDALYQYDILSDRNKDRISEEMFNACVPVVIPIIENLADWLLKNTNRYLDDMHPVIEKNLITLISASSSPTGQYIPISVMTSTPDMWNDAVVVDFKSGMRFQQSHAQQISFYEMLIGLHTNDGPRKKELVYLGHPSTDKNKMTRKVDALNEETLGEYLDRLMKHSFNCMTVENTGYAPAEYGFHCSFCEYRHECNGV